MIKKMRSSTLGLALSHVRPHIPPPTVPDFDTTPIIQYEDMRAEPIPSRLILYASGIVASAVVVFNIVYLVATY